MNLSVKPRLLTFDSGIGGLGIVRAMRAIDPDIAIDYLADNAIFPYGELDDAVLIKRVSSLLEKAITTFQPDAIVIACNTASTIALSSLRETFPRTSFIGCVPPIKWAADMSKTRYIGLLATRATVKRHYLTDLYTRYAPDCRLIAHGTRTLADIAEAAFRGKPIDQNIIKQELHELFSQPGGNKIDTVCLGCTHYTFLLEALKQHTSPSINWLDPANAVARQALKIASSLPSLTKTEKNRTKNPDSIFFTAPPFEANLLKTSLEKSGYTQPLRIFSVEDKEESEPSVFNVPG